MKITLPQLQRAAAAVGATVHVNADDDHVFDVGLEAPEGMKFKGYGFHEAIGSTEHPRVKWSADGTDRERVIASLFKDLNEGFEPCTDPACEWCGRACCEPQCTVEGCEDPKHRPQKR